MPTGSSELVRAARTALDASSSAERPSPGFGLAHCGRSRLSHKMCIKAAREVRSRDAETMGHARVGRISRDSHRRRCDLRRTELRSAEERSVSPAFARPQVCSDFLLEVRVQRGLLVARHQQHCQVIADVPDGGGILWRPDLIRRSATVTAEVRMTHTPIEIRPSVDCGLPPGGPGFWRLTRQTRFLW